MSRMDHKKSAEGLEYREALAATLRAEASRRNLSRPDIARLTGIPVQTYRYYDVEARDESGNKARVPDVIQVDLIARKAFGISSSEFYDLVDAELQHGTTSRYRCDECRAAKSDAWRPKRPPLRVERGPPQWSPGPVRVPGQHERR